LAKRDKRIERTRRNPKNVRPDEMDAILRDAGFIAHQEGSHKTYRRDGQKLTIPQRKPFLKAVYMRGALDLLDAWTALGEAENDEKEVETDDNTGKE
jgi:predicted RNA binding protein YcfA (HicA-like mRNA interferase family)